MIGEQVTVLTAAGTNLDPYSATQVPSWASPTSTVVPGVLVEPRPSGEPVQDARNAVTSGYTLYMPAGTKITAANRVNVRGDVYEVIGDPADWRLGGWRPGLVVQVERVRG